MKSKTKNNFLGKIIILIWIVLLMLSACGLMVEASSVTKKATVHRPEPAKENEYFELRATTINNGENGQGVNGKRQLIMELWGNDIIFFKGFEVRFRYDNTKLQPSIISDLDSSKTNTIDGVNPASDMEKYFKIDDDFAGILEFDNDIGEIGNDSNEIVGMMSLIPPATSSNPNIIDVNGKKAVSTMGGVKLGELSFRMLTDDEFDVGGFSLVVGTNISRCKTCKHVYDDGKESVKFVDLPDTWVCPSCSAIKDNYINYGVFSPETGIKINLDGDYHLDEQSTFRFTDMTASKDADLTNIVVSSGEVNTENPDESTYKEYDLTPEFKKEIKNYTITLMEYIDTINIKAEQSDEKATMKIKVPKHDSDGNLVYESDGTTIVYEEKDMTDQVPFGVTLNKLGEPDTKVTISITAEDGVSTNEYEILIKRPYGIIKGSIYTAPTDSKGIFKSNVRVYKTSDVNKLIDKSQIVEGVPDDVHDKLLTLKSQDVKTNDDGTYEIYVIPGTYDILLDKPGYLDYVYESREVAENQTMDLGNKEILAGDTNKDGIIEITDLTAVLEAFGMSNTDTDYNESTNFNDDDYVEITDLTVLLENYLESRKIE